MKGLFLSEDNILNDYIQSKDAAFDAMSRLELILNIHTKKSKVNIYI